MRLLPRWTGIQWAGALLMGISCVGAGWFLQERSHAIPPVPLADLGLAADHAEKAQLVAAGMPKFQLIGAAAADDHSAKNVRLWDAVLQLHGDHLPNVPQQIGDCVSWGAANAVNYLQAVQIIRGPPAEFHPAFPPYIYGTSRVDVGAKHGSRFRGDGSIGAYAAEAVGQYGVLRADHDKCPPYSGSVAREWGAKGPPAWAKEVARSNLVQTVAQVDSAAEARDAIAGAQCPVTIASGWWGTTDIPIVNGRRVARRTTSWAHQQCLVAYDGSQPGEPLFYCLNSWGPNAHPAPLQGEPPGGYWIRFSDVDRICREGDSWAFSAFDGFPAAGPDWDELLRRPTTSLAPIVPTHGGGIMFTVELGVCCLIGLLGLVLFRMARRRVVATAALAVAVCGIGSAGRAQDFDAAATRATATIEADGAAATDDPMGWTRAATRPPVTCGTPADLESCWDVAAVRQVAQKTAATGGKPQALVFVREYGCSDCMRVKAHIKAHVEPLGWTSGQDPTADFRLVDVQRNPELASVYRVEVVPTTIYLDRNGRVMERREGFSTHRNWTGTLRRAQN